MKDNKWYNLDDKEEIKNIECNGDCANCEHYNIEWVDED